MVLTKSLQDFKPCNDIVSIRFHLLHRLNEKQCKAHLICGMTRPLISSQHHFCQFSSNPFNLVFGRITVLP